MFATAPIPEDPGKTGMPHEEQVADVIVFDEENNRTLQLKNGRMIILTSLAGDQQSTVSAGLHGYITKPFSVNLAQINLILAHQRKIRRLNTLNAIRTGAACAAGSIILSMPLNSIYATLAAGFIGGILGYEVRRSKPA